MESLFLGVILVIGGLSQPTLAQSKQDENPFQPCVIQHCSIDPKVARNLVRAIIDYEGFINYNDRSTRHEFGEKKLKEYVNKLKGENLSLYNCLIEAKPFLESNRDYFDGRMLTKIHAEHCPPKERDSSPVGGEVTPRKGKGQG